MLKGSKLRGLLIFVFTIISGGASWSTSDNCTVLLFSWSTGVFVSLIFFILLVELPKRDRRKRIKRNLASQYHSFKLACIDEFLILSHSQDYKNREALLDFKEFQRHFNAESAEHRSRWDAVVNGLNDENSASLQDVIFQIRMLNEEVIYARNAIDIIDQKINKRITSFSHSLYRQTLVKQEYEDIKQLAGYLWEIFAGWNIVEGQKKTDVIQDWLDQM